MKAHDLRDALGRLRRALKPRHVHLIGDERGTRLAAALPSGHQFSCRLEATPTPFNCMVDLEVLLSMVPVRGDVALSEAGGVLTVRSGRSRGQVPSVVSEPPELPRVAEGGRGALSLEDSQWLKGILPLVSLSKTDVNGNTSIEGVDGSLRVCTYDDVHGAFAYRKSDTTVRIGLLPADSSILLTAITNPETKLTIATTDDHRVLVSNGQDRLVLPCVDPASQPRDSVYGTCAPAWKLTGPNLMELVSSMSAVASAKEAGPIFLQSSNGRLLASVTSPAGKLERMVETNSVERVHPRLGLSYELLADLSGRMAKEPMVIAYLEPGDRPTTRVVFRTAQASYVMLTSGE